MTDDTLSPPDDEELEAANALRQALEGRPGGPRVPEEALETAAFLRHAGEHGALSSERRAQLRGELLASLPPVPARSPHKGWRHWFGIGITLLGAASAAVTVGVLGVREWSRHDPAGEARSQAMESAANDLETSAAAGGADAPTAMEVRAVPAAPTTTVPETPMLAAPDEPMFAQRAFNGLAQGEQESPATGSVERRRTIGRQSTTPSTEAAPSKRARAEAPAAMAREAAPADDDGALALGAASDLRGTESKGGGAAARPPASIRPAPVSAAGPAANASSAASASSADARSERQRRERRARLLAQLDDERVQSAYRAADGARSVAELEQARERLTALSSAGLGGASTAAAAEQLRPDVHCRLTEIALRLGQPRAALDWARQGLELGTQPSPFVACLYQQQGRAREALGDRDGAAQSYMNALKVNEQLLDESLEGP